MKLNKICAASAVLALAVALTACGGSASTAASSTASSEAASSVAASPEAAESAEYTVYNTILVVQQIICNRSDNNP